MKRSVEVMCLQSEVDISSNIMLLSHCGVDLNDPEYVCLYLFVCVSFVSL